MTIDIKADGTDLTMTLGGRLDTTTAPQLEAAIRTNIAGVEKLVFDFEDLDYISPCLFMIF